MTRPLRKPKPPNKGVVEMLKEAEAEAMPIAKRIAETEPERGPWLRRPTRLVPELPAITPASQWDKDSK